MSEPLRVMTRPAGQGRLEARLDGELLLSSDCILYPAARMMLARGVPPETLLTTRAEGRDYDNFKPMPIGDLAYWTIDDGKTGPKLARWRPFAVLP